nr:hypothetical protein L204_04760 [Cryptococcus depauperatus CBS 7855]
MAIKAAEEDVINEAVTSRRSEDEELSPSWFDMWRERAETAKLAQEGENKV